MTNIQDRQRRPNIPMIDVSEGKNQSKGKEQIQETFPKIKKYLKPDIEIVHNIPEDISAG